MCSYRVGKELPLLMLHMLARKSQRRKIITIIIAIIITITITITTKENCLYNFHRFYVFVSYAFHFTETNFGYIQVFKYARVQFLSNVREAWYMWIYEFACECFSILARRKYLRHYHAEILTSRYHHCVPASKFVLSVSVWSPKWLMPNSRI